MRVCIFEDQGYEDLTPLTLFRPTFELRCGCGLLWEKVVRSFPGADFAFFARDHLVPTLKKRLAGYPINNPSVLRGDDLLFINGRWLFVDSPLSAEGPEEIGLCDESVAYARVRSGTATECFCPDFQTFLENIRTKIRAKQVSATLISYPWDLINHNGEAIAQDFESLGNHGIKGKFSPQAVVYGDQDKVFVAEGAEIQPYTVLDTTHGPVIIKEGTLVQSFTHIEGPAYIGENSKIFGREIREGTAIGPVCYVGGEIEETIIQGYTNKVHTGFLGHSYLGEWVNLGATTTSSDLKNNYGQVKVPINGDPVDSGELKVGSFVGDHTKLGIGTQLNTGSVIGACCNIFWPTLMPPKYVPSFSWGGEKFIEYELDKVIETAEIVMGRRDVEQRPEDVELLRKVHQLTANEREEYIT